ncbi:hypothetical protein [Polyangium sp. 15x6]|uniref:hypothetical protein n=1 Tax=Polyangium sp. 15x6 TaxID=3042687 RepID=UPI00249A0CD7|nr:hypothetical protein [Polyangium sp. 15x6]MDI3282014.1 hypothetical protein [Polyangium sp. 15x6]
MRNLTANDLFLGVQDMLTERKADLELSVIGKLYTPQLSARLVLLEALPERQATRANAGALAETDSRHDAFGDGIWCYTEAVLVTPGVSAEARAAAQRVRDAFVPNRGRLVDSYAEEAAQAKKNRPKLDELEADLGSLPVPDGKTLLHWALGFVDAGETLDKLLSDRSSTEATAASKPATELRTTTIGLLRRFRDALRDEVATNPALPRDLESRVFAYIDELSARRAKKKKDEQPPAG